MIEAHPITKHPDSFQEGIIEVVNDDKEEQRTMMVRKTSSSWKKT